MVSVTFKSADGEETIISVKTGVSIQEAAINNDVPGIDADCGGGCSCATCHVYVADEWLEKVGPPGELEASMLEVVEGSATLDLRFADQAVLRGAPPAKRAKQAAAERGHATSSKARPTG